MATDIAFTLGLLTLLGRRVPFALIVFVSALAIADDLGAILVIALFYTSDISLTSLIFAGIIMLLLIGLERSSVRRPWPYVVLGIALWIAVLSSGLHPTIAGVLLALTIPLRSPPDTTALLAQSTTALHWQAVLERDGRNHDSDGAAIHTLETVIERLESPADRIRRHLEPWTAYLILPLFALANAGVALSPQAFDLFSPVGSGILLGLVIGKPLGITALAWAATRLGIAEKPDQIEWRQLFAAACLCGIGFTMSIFIATSAFADHNLLANAKLSVIVASVVAGIIGWMLLTRVTAPATQATRAAEATLA
jgi:NhaA family Na+:H+ antiporter